jgi:hypothetical protein
MIKFEIEEITNGYLIKGDMGYYEDAKGDYVDDFVIFAHTLADAFAMIANKCDQLSDEEASKPPEIDDGLTEPLPF